MRGITLMTFFALLAVVLLVTVALAAVNSKVVWLVVTGLTTVFGTIASVTGAIEPWNAFPLFFVAWGGLCVFLGNLPSGNRDRSLLQDLLN